MLSDIKGEFDVVIDIVVHTSCDRILLINIIIFFLQILSGHLL